LEKYGKMEGGKWEETISSCIKFLSFAKIVDVSILYFQNLPEVTEIAGFFSQI